MRTDEFSLDKAELLAVIMEALLYGLSMFMFGGTIWTLASQRPNFHVRCKMLTASCSLLLFSTAHLVIDIIRVMEAFILLPDAYQGGRIKFLTNVSHWTFVSKNYLYAAQTLIGDGVVLYRCYTVWQSKLVMVVPVLFWCGVALTGFACPYTESRLVDGWVFDRILWRWITSFWSLSLTTNILTTLLLAYRIWNVDRKVNGMNDKRKSELQHILRIIIDAGGIYSLSLFTALIVYINKSNGQYVIVDMLMPIISITFYMVIIRVGLANQANQHRQSLGHSSAHSLNGERRSRVQSDLATLGGSKVDNGLRLSMPPRSPTFSDNHRPNEIRFEDIKEDV